MYRRDKTLSDATLEVLVVTSLVLNRVFYKFSAHGKKKEYAGKFLYFFRGKIADMRISFGLMWFNLYIPDKQTVLPDLDFAIE